VSLTPHVQDNFRRYDLLDDQVKFLKGWSSNTWKAGRVVVGVPARIRTGLIKNRRRS
jgi:hypothetical protein